MRPRYFDDSTASGDLRRHSLRSGAITVLAQGTMMVLQVVSTIVLARLLLPEDFGLVAMVTAVTGYATIFLDLGTRDAIAQRERILEGEVSALFWITFALGLALAAATAACAPLIARFYGEPRVAGIAAVMSLTFVLPALYLQQHGLMRRALMFRELAVIDVASNLVATVATIALAYAGHGYWALVGKPLLTLTLIAAGVLATCRWWPGRPTFNAGVRETLKFGLNITGFTVTDFVARSADRVALGHTAGPRELGFYQNAFVIYDNVLALFAPLHNVASTSLSKLRNDHAELRRSWSSALSSVAYFAAPAFAILAVTANDLVVLLLGVKWAKAGPILTILALRGPAHVVERTLGWLHIASGRADRWRRWGLLNCGALLIALACGLPFGAIGVAAAYTTCVYLLFIPAIAYAGEPLGIRAADVWKTVGPQVATSLGAAAACIALGATLLRDAPGLVRLLSLGAACAIGYLAVMTFVFRITRPLSIAASLIRRRTADAADGTPP
jgi:polysaccharide transporter, PST family